MSEERTGTKLFTRDKANWMLPWAGGILKQLKASRVRIFGLQARLDILELTASAIDQIGYQKKQDWLLEELGTEMAEVRMAEGIIRRFGGRLSEIDGRMHVDFYSVQNDQIVCLCWREGEEEVTHYHAAEQDCRHRRSL